ncbi:unnamed protein product [Moneuplotes crassus]|uniref:Uncharacterized protein n=1 Tax=Euplotes crassus TaxID=5936 RepID=A0AAD1Y4X0_EUPCR|nr:unnamed protein product [Moneuplotes crassus]
MESDSKENDHGSSECYHDSFSEEAKQINLSLRYDTADNFVGSSKNIFMYCDEMPQDLRLKPHTVNKKGTTVTRDSENTKSSKDRPKHKKRSDQEGRRSLMKRRNRLANMFIKNMSTQMNQLKIEQYGSARVIDNELEKYRYNIYSISFLAILGVLICGVEQELFIKYGKDHETTDRVILLSVNLFITFLVIALTIMSYFQEVFIRRAEGVLLTIDTLDKKRIICLIFEIVLNLIHPMPFLANTTFQEKIYVLDISLPKRYDCVLYLAMLHIRFYHFLRQFLLSSDFMTNRAFRVCKISKTNCNKICFSACFCLSTYRKNSSISLPLLGCYSRTWYCFSLALGLYILMEIWTFLVFFSCIIFAPSLNLSLTTTNSCE